MDVWKFSGLAPIKRFTAGGKLLRTEIGFEPRFSLLTRLFWNDTRLTHLVATLRHIIVTLHHHQPVPLFRDAYAAQNDCNPLDRG